ncbi:MAG: hypothetical protein CMN30_29110, partial [Sandaracinus sp.]|nr:hypothetical protein [Sandaracinus sp.]
LFIKPLLENLLGQSETSERVLAILTEDVPADETRTSYRLGSMSQTAQGQCIVKPVAKTDSAQISPFSTQNVLVEVLPQPGAQLKGLPVACIRI